MTDRITRRALAPLGLGALALAGCADAADPLEGDLPSMGNFQLDQAIVVADKIKQVPPSRRAEPEAWDALMTAELTRRFGQYRGGRRYHVALALDGYSLAPPGIPIVLAPKSLLVASANLWDAAETRKLLGPEQLTVFEGAESLILGTGLIKSAEEQMQTLTRNMAARVQRWLLDDAREVLSATG